MLVYIYWINAIEIRNKFSLEAAAAVWYFNAIMSLLRTRYERQMFISLMYRSVNRTQVIRGTLASCHAAGRRHHGALFCLMSRRFKVTACVSSAYAPPCGRSAVIERKPQNTRGLVSNAVL